MATKDRKDAKGTETGARRAGNATTGAGNVKGQRMAQQQGASGTLDQAPRSGPGATRHVEGRGLHQLRQGTPETEDLEG